ncbi:MAG: efflux RND transporter periplasmic adaptor subunit [Acidobacteriaceae bacterium]|nr:efflux RND transporter periplasmic adaptor subunit [Acidobacteriaceae bacterium]
MSKQLRRYNLVLALLFASVCAVLLASCGKGKKQDANAAFMMMMQTAPVRAVPAVATDVPLDASAVGNVEAISSVDVKSRVAGQILRVAFQEGQNVEKGQLLFEIDPEPLERQIAETQADIAKDAALEQQARANVVKDQAMLKQAGAAADRGLQLQKEGIFSKEQTEQVVATNDSAKASLDADQAAVESAVASAKADRARLAQTELQLTYTKITAPITGRAGAIAVKAGNLIKDNDAALVTLLEMSPIYVSFGLPEQLLPEVRKYNQEHPLLIQATSGDAQTPVTGTLKFIDNTVDTTTGTIKLKAEFPNTDRSLWPGEFVNVQARLNLEHNRVVIPSRTVQTGPQGKYVWVMNASDNTVSIRPIQVLRDYSPPKSLEEAVIGSGLKPGEMVISEGQMRLAPGMKVRLLKADTQMGQQSSPAQSPDNS